MAGFLDLEPEANAEFIRLADQHVEVPGGKNVLPGVVWAGKLNQTDEELDTPCNTRTKLVGCLGFLCYTILVLVFTMQPSGYSIFWCWDGCWSLAHLLGIGKIHYSHGPCL